MTLISSLHNLSRSLGYALLATSETVELIVIVVGGEIVLYLIFKVVRDDLFYWIPASGSVATAMSILQRIGGKILVDFTGCFHLRHPFEMGGLGFTLSLFWAQIFPFLAMHFSHEEGIKKSADYDIEVILVFLVISFLLWLIMTIVFFCTVDSSYLHTFFGTKTAPQYSCELYFTSREDFQKFDAIFTIQTQYTKSIHKEVKEWVAENIDKWKREKPAWFNIEKIPDEFLPKHVLESEGGENRRRSSVSLKEITRFWLGEGNSKRVHPLEGEEMKVEDL